MTREIEEKKQNLDVNDEVSIAIVAERDFDSNYYWMYLIFQGVWIFQYQ